ncbi:MAG TPA: hypothetical protein VFM13_01500 [Gaiellaceae bacterium]|nr:hypothetical protein [Gaiellaceae bacterium]
MKLRLALGLVLVGLASACGGSDDGGGGGGGGGDDSGTVKVTLEEQNGSGKSGTAELFPGAASTDVTIEITGGASDLDPIYVRGGSCDSPGSEIVHDVGFTNANLGQGQIFETIDKVATGEYILIIEDDKTMKPIMCGAIPEQ